MSSVMEKRFIDVLSCEDNVVTIPSLNNKGYTFEPGTVNDPCVIPIPPEEIQYMNSTSTAFKNGVLRFRPDEQEDVYTALGIKKDDIMFIEDIDDALLNPTVENLQRMIDVKNSSQFERIRGRFYQMKNAGEDMSTKVKGIIDGRYEELRAGKLHSDIIVSPVSKPVDASKVQEELENAKNQMTEMQKQMQAMMAQMQQMMAGAQPATQANPTKRGRKKAEAEKAEVVPAE